MRRIRQHGLELIAVAACCLSLASCGMAAGQVERRPEATGGWRNDKPAVKRLLEPEDLPGIAKPTYGAADVVAMPAGAAPQLPDGFSAVLVPTSGLHKPRVIRVAPNGDLFVADSMFGSVQRHALAQYVRSLYSPRRENGANDQPRRDCNFSDVTGCPSALVAMSGAPFSGRGAETFDAQSGTPLRRSLRRTEV